ncbi:hypothetical protein IQ268_28770 [Oculatella sp. LEGE 06141]|uniref:hypothetical protein n=1 Tax=Oculatella sp. LEGE 06141 TaxID=1828648 RepID=UPI001881EBA0|nr:hypothetical protein [Oculatella sp. LEGE 06141]MBE9182548.1 hypothetical protein [Oculatella sp. LEGE 06141]
MPGRKKSKIELLLEALADGEWHWGQELAAKVGWRFGDPVMRAKRKGYLIDVDRVGLQHRYRLLK